MQAYEIAYSPDETQVALGWPGGRVAVHRVCEEDGSPGDEVCVVDAHRSSIVHVAWWEDAIVSASVDGSWVVANASTGEVLRHGSVGGEYVRASSRGSSLFLFTYDGDAKGVRVDLQSGTQALGPDIDDHIGVTARVFALSEDVALYHFIADNFDTDVTEEGFVYVDFAANTAERKVFSRGPSSDFDEGSRLMAIDPARRVGVRPDYGPVALEGEDEEARAVLKVEVFDVDTLEPQASQRVLAWPQHLMRSGPEAAILEAEPGSEEYVDACDWFVRKLCSAAFVRDTDDVWITASHGVARRVPLSGDTKSAIVIHGGGPDTGPPTLDDLFARNLINNHTLGVSVSGAYVGYGNPNDFLSTRTTDVSAATQVKLPMRKDPNAAEAPGCLGFAGSRLVLFDRGEGMHFADAATGEPERRVALQEYYGDARDVSLSPDGKELVVAVAAGDSFVYLFDDDELGGLPVPPHGIFAEHLDHRFVMGHHGGAVLVFDPKAEAMDAIRSAWEEGEEPEREWDAFEQRDSMRAVATYRVNEAWFIATLDEEGEVQTYSIEGAELSVGSSFEGVGWRMCGGAGWLAMASDTELRIVDMPAATTRATLEFEQLLGIFATPSGQLYALERSGELSIVEPDGTQKPVATLPAQLSAASLSEPANRIAVVTATGTVELFDLTGTPVATLAVQPADARVREVVRRA